MSIADVIVDWKSGWTAVRRIGSELSNTTNQWSVKHPSALTALRETRSRLKQLDSALACAEEEMLEAFPEGRLPAPSRVIRDAEPFPLYEAHVDAYIRVLKARLAEESRRADAATESAARAMCIAAGEDPDIMVFPSITMPDGYTKPSGPPRPWWTFKAAEMEAEAAKR